jgi:pilus assembly protein CpaE
VNLDPNASENLKKIGHLPRQFPNISFFAMSQLIDANLLMEAMHLGVKEFIPLPISEDKFSAAIERVAQTYGMGKKARVIHVIPTMGGCGSTTVACNVAASLAQESKTALIDLDLMRGGVAGSFDCRPRYTIADIMASADKVDKQLLDNALAIHRGSNLAILARPELPEDSQRVNQPGLHRLLNILGRMFDNVVIDSMMSIDPIYTTAIQASDLNVIVMQLNVPSAKNAERFVGAMRRMGIEANKIRIVVNRFVKKGWDIEPAEVERALGLKISWMVPNDFKNAIAAINFGEPVVLRAPKSEMSVSLKGLAQALNSKTLAQAA